MCAACALGRLTALLATLVLTMWWWAAYHNRIINHQSRKSRSRTHTTGNYPCSHFGSEFDYLLLHLVAQPSRCRGSATVMPPKVNRPFRYRRAVRKPAYRWAIFALVDPLEAERRFVLGEPAIHHWVVEQLFFSRFPVRKTYEECQRDRNVLISEGVLEGWTSRPCRIVDFGRPRPRQPLRGIAQRCFQCGTYHVDRPCARVRGRSLDGRRIWVEMRLGQEEPRWGDPEWQNGH